MNFSQLIELKIEELGIDQKALSVLVGTSQPSISQLITGKSNRTKFVPEFSKALGVSPNVISLAMEGKLTKEILEADSKLSDLNLISDTNKRNDPAQAEKDLDKYLHFNLDKLLPILDKMDYKLDNEDADKITSYITIKSLEAGKVVRWDIYEEVKEKYESAVACEDSDLPKEDREELIIKFYKEAAGLTFISPEDRAKIIERIAS